MLKLLASLVKLTPLVFDYSANHDSGIYISTLPDISVEDNMLITILGKVLPLHTVTISKVDPHVLEVDTFTAWKELELSSRWSNEVEVKIYINPTA